MLKLLEDAADLLSAHYTGLNKDTLTHAHTKKSLLYIAMFL